MYQVRRQPLLPNLQRLPSYWKGKATSSTSALDCYEAEVHPVELTPCNTYFFKPNESNIATLKVITVCSLTFVFTLRSSFLVLFLLHFLFSSLFDAVVIALLCIEIARPSVTHRHSPSKTPRLRRSSLWNFSGTSHGSSTSSSTWYRFAVRMQR
jgi:hypothetical protein